MEIPVLIEPVAGNGYVAKTGEPLALRAEGATRAEALKKLEDQLAQQPANGSPSRRASAEPAANPLLAMAGMYDPNDPLVQEWIEIMAENRRKADEDPDYP